MENRKWKNNLRKLTYAAVCLALAQVLPLITGGIPEIGNMLSPMHLPVLLCGFLCGTPWGGAVGAVAPILRNLIFGQPAPLYPRAIVMMFELAAYGALSGLLTRILPKKMGYVYVSLVAAMLGGRVVRGLAKLILFGIEGNPFTAAMFFSGYFVESWPGMVVQIILIPLVVLALRRSRLMPDD